MPKIVWPIFAALSANEWVKADHSRNRKVILKSGLILFFNTRIESITYMNILHR